MYFVLAFVATLVVDFVITIIDGGRASADWEMAIRNGLIFALVFPSLHSLKMK